MSPAPHLCAQCKEGIIGQVMSVGAEHFHPGCFCCGSCDKPITGAFNIGEGGKRLCAECVPKVFCQACKACIDGEVLIFGTKTYHPSCFKCHTCDKPIAGTVYPSGDYLRCEACATGGTTTSGAPPSAAGVEGRKMCRRCKEPITGKMVLADRDDAFHEVCFRCAECEGPMEQFMVDESRRFKHQDFCYVCKDCVDKKHHRKEGEEIMLSTCQPQWPGATRCGAGSPSGAHVFPYPPEAPSLPGTSSVATPPCCICKEACAPSDKDKDEDCFQLVDGSVMHWRCFRCTTCGAREEPSSSSTTLVLLRAKVNDLRKGTYRCDRCQQSARLDVEAGVPTASIKGALEAGVPTASIEEALEAEMPELVHEAAPKFSGTLTLAELLNADVWKAKGVDPGSREQHLSDSEFVSVFCMSKEAFLKLPRWKRDALKKGVNLF